MRTKDVFGILITDEIGDTVMQELILAGKLLSLTDKYF